MNVLPFPCTRPAPEFAAEVAALPYDVFDRAEAAAYVEGRDRSFLNIDRPETQFAPDQDMYAPEVYAKGAELLQGRVEDGTYVEDRNRAYYIYDLTWQGRTQTGIAAVCPVDAYEQGVIRRHELTREEKERDRIEHIRALGCQTGPIFLTYRDQPVLDMIISAAKGGSTLYDFTDDQGVRQRVWEVARPESVEAIHAMFAQVPCAYIADGHHRAASAVKVAQMMRDEARAAGTYTGKEPFNFVLSVLFPASQLAILPYNRVVFDRAGCSGAELVERVEAAGFAVERAEGAVEPQMQGEFGMFAEGAWYRLRPQDAPAEDVEDVSTHAPCEGVPGSHAGAAPVSPEGGFTVELDNAHAEGQDADDPVSALDVLVLQRLILEPVLGISDSRTDPRIAFVGGIRGTDELERRAGEDGVAFTLAATGIDQLLAVADAGLVMPPKSTWFEPKLRSGLFIHRIAPR